MAWRYESETEKSQESANVEKRGFVKVVADLICGEK